MPFVLPVSTCLFATYDTSGTERAQDSVGYLSPKMMANSISNSVHGAHVLPRIAVYSLTYTTEVRRHCHHPDNNRPTSTLSPSL